MCCGRCPRWQGPCTSAWGLPHWTRCSRRSVPGPHQFQGRCCSCRWATAHCRLGYLASRLCLILQPQLPLIRVPCPVQPVAMLALPAPHQSMLACHLWTELVQHRTQFLRPAMAPQGILLKPGQQQARHSRLPAVPTLWHAHLKPAVMRHLVPRSCHMSVGTLRSDHRPSRQLCCSSPATGQPGNPLLLCQARGPQLLTCARTAPELSAHFSPRAPSAPSALWMLRGRALRRLCLYRVGFPLVWKDTVPHMAHSMSLTFSRP
mmetsp:Transcript_14065/g.30470  ORF Transcript_14065/g.30470 Transcript_14065/m.30470 type:complete len:262 (+) Transcript_14065:703-1488(+)